MIRKGAVATVIGLCGAWAAAAAEGDAVWEFAAGGAIFGSPATDSAGNVYFGSRDGKAYSLDAQGQLRWAYAAGDWVDSSPTLSPDESAVYFGSWDNYLYAVSAVDGALLWRFETGSLVLASPAVDGDGNLYFGSSDGFFYSLDSEGNVRWFYLVGEELDSSPAVAADGSVYVGAYDGVVYAFDQAGDLQWSFATGLEVAEEERRIKAPPTVDAEGRVYVGAGDGNVYALSSAGEELWRFAALEAVDTGVALGANGSLHFGSRDGYLYSVDAFGVLNWESYVGDVFYSTPMVDEFGRVYVGAYLGNGVSGVSVLSREGEILWDSLTLDFIDSSPLLSGDGLLYYGSYDGVFYAVEARAAMGASAWARFGGDGSNRGRQRPMDGPLTVSPEFAAWLQSYGLFGETAKPGNDADGDGWGVLLEYWLGGDPAVGEASLVDWSREPGGADQYALRFNRSKLESTFGLGLEASLDLQEWVAADTEQLELEEAVLQADAFGDGAYETVELSAKAEGTFFLRLAAQGF